MSDKTTGSYYTPPILAEFLVKHIFSNHITDSFKQFKILEPSCGDGQFLEPFLKDDYLKKIEKTRFDLIDINAEELSNARFIVENLKSSTITSVCSHQDFLDYKSNESYNLIIGNPPYINKKHLSKEQIAKCRTICENSISDFGETKNIWPAFLIQSIKMLASDGVLCFVLPSEILQVKYTQKIREYLLSEFQKVEIFAFNELIFSGIQQDVVVVLGVKKLPKLNSPTVSFYQVNKLEDLKIPDYIKKHTNIHRKKLDKWTNYILEDSELDLIETLTNENSFKPLDEYCEKVEVGIVTAANDFFIVSDSTAKKYDLVEYCHPIVSKGGMIKDRTTLSKRDLSLFRKGNQKINLVSFPKDKDQINEKATRYIKIGERLHLNQRYKMKRRFPWFQVPSIWSSEAFFIKRSHEYPRMVLNSAKTYLTDSFYRIVTKKDIDSKSLVFSFYNSLTFTLAELEGRYYGGGVLELTPNECKKLNMPYLFIEADNFRLLEKKFRDNESIYSILDYTDSILLKNLTEKERQKVREIRNKLLNRRLKLGQSKTQVKPMKQEKVSVT